MSRIALVMTLLLAAAPALAQTDEALLRLVNAERQANGLAPLSLDAAAERAADRHAADMARNGVLTHDGSDGSDIGDRLIAAGLRWCMAAENVAQGQQSAEQVMRDWMDSPGHRRNILSDATLMGAARDGAYWVLTFARGC